MGIRSRLAVVKEITLPPSENLLHMVVEADGHVIDNRYSYVMTTGELEHEYEWLVVSDYNLRPPWREAVLDSYR